jgi:hypothetical protein
VAVVKREVIMQNKPSIYLAGVTYLIASSATSLVHQVDLKLQTLFAHQVDLKLQTLFAEMSRLPL